MLILTGKMKYGKIHFSSTIIHFNEIISCIFKNKPKYRNFFCLLKRPASETCCKWLFSIPKVKGLRLRPPRLILRLGNFGEFFFSPNSANISKSVKLRKMQNFGVFLSFLHFWDFPPRKKCVFYYPPRKIHEK